MLVLAVVDRGIQHGYAIIETLRSLSEGTLDLPEGTVYPLLHRLERRGFITSSWTRNGRKRRVYELTREGHDYLHRQRQEWSLLNRVVEGILAP